MATKVSSICPEKNSYVAEKDLKIDAQAEEAENRELGIPLAIGALYILLPQKTTGVTYDIPDVGKRISQRYWAVEFRNNKPVAARTIGRSSLRAQALSLWEKGVEPDEVGIRMVDGHVRAETGAYTVRALNDTSFMRAKDGRYIIDRPTALTVTDRTVVWQTNYDNATKDMESTIKDDGTQVIVQHKNNRFYIFHKEEEPSEALVAVAKKFLESDESLKGEIYLL